MYRLAPIGGYNETIKRYKKNALISFSVMLVIMSFILAMSKSDDIGGAIFFFITASIGSWLNFINSLEKKKCYQKGTIKKYKNHYVIFYGTNNLVVIPRINDVLSFYTDKTSKQQMFCLRLGYIGCFCKTNTHNKPLLPSSFGKKLIWAIGSTEFDKNIFPFKYPLLLSLIVAAFAVSSFWVYKPIGLAFSGLSIGYFVSSIFFLCIKLKKDFRRGRLKEFQDKNISLINTENNITIRMQYRDKDIYAEKIKHITIHTVRIGFIEGLYLSEPSITLQ